MALNFQSLHVTILALLGMALFLDVVAQLGGWKAIVYTSDPTVLEMGKFAISQHNNEAKSGLHFLSVVRGETQVVSGLNYKLVIAAKDGSASHQYETVVWDKPREKSRTLSSFKELN